MTFPRIAVSSNTEWRLRRDGRQLGDGFDVTRHGRQMSYMAAVVGVLDG